MEQETSEPSSGSSVDVVETSEALVFNIAAHSNSIFLDPKLNHTPVQCVNLMKLRRGKSDNITFRNDRGGVRAVVSFPDEHCVSITVYGIDGTELWTDTVRAEECVPDVPNFLIPKIRPMYRALTAAFMLFLLVLFPIMLIYPYAGPAFATAASIGVVLVVVACVALLILVRTWLKL